tara:strand:- start:1134 stop:1967 length:834 start_codon:yes stop_codon:yes gene_type:complete
MDEDREYLDIKEIYNFIKSNMKLIGKAVVLSSLLSIFISFISSNKYTTSIVFASAEKKDQLGDSLNRLQNLSGFAGLSLDSSSNSNFTQFTEYYLSSEVIKEIIDKYDVRPAMTSKNPEGKAFFSKEDIYADPRRLQETLLSQVKQRVYRDLGFVELYMEHEDSNLSTEILSAIHFANESHFKQVTKDVTLSKIFYLDNKLKEVKLEEQRKSLLKLKEQEMNLLAIIDSDAPYVIRKVTGPNTTIEPTSPNIIYNLIIYNFIGILLVLFLSTRRTKT